MFYLMTYSTHFLYRKEGNVLFNDTLNTFYLWLYGFSHMVKYHTYSKRGNPLPPHGLLFLINSKGSFLYTIPDRIAFGTPVVEHWLDREIAQWVHPMKDRSDDPSHHERTLLPRSYIFFTWHQTCGKGPLSVRKPAANSRTALSN